jgi:hypothetical protein
MRADPGVHAIFFGPAIGFGDNCATSVIFGNLRHQLRIVVQGTRLFAVNGKIHKRCAGHCAFAFLPELFQLLLNLSELDWSA